ncbi:MAG: response regulator [Thermodesulfobacteriota bacterium]
MHIFGNTSESTLHSYAAATLVVWLCLLAGSLAWYHAAERKHAMTAAKNDALIHFNKDQAFRFWAASHGGVYVQPDADTPPNPYLAALPDRDVVTASGKRLTLMNPAYMMRQVMERYSEYYGVRGRITSSRPINPQNAPDAWETAALAAFEKGSPEESAFIDIDGQPHIRLMRPMRVDESCLKCHGYQDYRVGDVRGGISIAVPMAPYLAMEHQMAGWIYFWHGLIGLAGSAFIAFLLQRSRTYLRHQAAAHRELDRCAANWQHTFDAMGDAVFIIDRQHTIARANAAARALFGRRQPEGLFCFTLAHGRGCPLEGCPVEQVFASGIPVKKLELQEPHLGNRWFEVSLYPICNEQGEVEYATHIISDISERKQTELILAESRRQAEEASQAKSRFLANMSHEIRTPMNGLMGMLDLAQRRETDEEIQDYLEMARTSSERLLRVIDDILDFSKIEAGKMELERIGFHLRRCVDGAVKLLAARAHDKGIEFNCLIDRRVPDHLVGDPGRLRQILLNLVGNAIKFTEKGEVTVTARLWQEQDDNADPFLLHFQVRDTGIGIASDKQQEIFLAFQQEDSSTTRHHGGTGLGLAISSQLAALMGGRIWLESGKDLGSTFHFTIRLGRDGNFTAMPAATPLPAIRVLVVDGNATSRFILREMLQYAGLPVSVAESGRQALELAAGMRLALVSGNLPDSDILVLSRQLRERQANLRVICMATVGQRGDVDRLRTAGIDGFLLKPISREELYGAVADAAGIETPGGLSARAMITRHSVQESRNFRILLIEDELINRTVTETLLREEGFAVTAVGDGRQALDLLAAEDFELILTDIQMPEMDGFEVAARVRQLQKKARIPIIALTAHAIKGYREKCLAAGMDGYIAKPVRIGALRREVERIHRTLPAGRAADVQAPLDHDAFLVRNCRGNRKLAREMIEHLLRESGPKWLAETSTAIAGNDFEHLRAVCHTMAGAAGILCAAELGEAAKALGTMAREKRRGELGEGLARLEAAFARIRDWAKAMT